MTEPDSSPPPPLPGPGTASGKPEPGADRRTRNQQRLAREAAVRRSLFVASLAAFAAILGIVTAAGRAAPVDPVDPPGVGSGQGSGRVVAEIPVAGIAGEGNSGDVIIRIVTPDGAAVAPHLRTRAS